MLRFSKSIKESLERHPLDYCFFIKDSSIKKKVIESLYLIALVAINEGTIESISSGNCFPQ